VDAWGFLNTKDPEKAKAQDGFALLAVDPVVNAAFAAKKGSSPVRTDVDPNSIDACNKIDKFSCKLLEQRRPSLQ
jgi:glucose/mannose transport system substrate-binding protein